MEQTHISPPGHDSIVPAPPTRRERSRGAVANVRRSSWKSGSGSPADTFRDAFAKSRTGRPPLSQRCRNAYRTTFPRRPIKRRSLLTDSNHVTISTLTIKKRL